VPDLAAEAKRRVSAAAGWWAPLSTVRLWGGVLAALMPGRQSGGVSGVWEQLATYPACLVAYSLGIAASAARRYDVLAWTLTVPVPNERSEWRPLVELIHPYTINERVGPHLRDVKFQPSPLSDHLHTVIRPLFGDLVPRDEHFEREFDRFEMLGGLARYYLAGARGRTYGCRWGGLFGSVATWTTQRRRSSPTRVPRLRPHPSSCVSWIVTRQRRRKQSMASMLRSRSS
jgi:hypothetical protein